MKFLGLLILGVALIVTSVSAGAGIGNTPAVISDPPIPEFTSDVTTGVSPLVVRFTDTSYGNTSLISSREWSYKKMGQEWTVFSTDQNPTMTFTGGVFFITLQLNTDCYPSGFILNTKGNYISVSEPVVTTVVPTFVPVQSPTPMPIQVVTTPTPRIIKPTYKAAPRVVRIVGTSYYVSGEPAYVTTREVYV